MTVVNLKLSREIAPESVSESIPVAREPQARVVGGCFDADGCALGRDRATTLASAGTEHAVPGALPEHRNTALRNGYAACILPG